MRPFIVIGDQTDHGGVVVASSMTTDTHGKRLARVGDQVTCPKKGHGTTVIVTGVHRSSLCVSQEGVHLKRTVSSKVRSHLYLSLGYAVDAPTCL